MSATAGVARRYEHKTFVSAIADFVGKASLPRLIAGLALIGSGIIHMTQIEAHLQEWQPAGFFFIFVTVSQLVFGGLLLVRMSRAAAILPLLLSVVVTAIWAISRTTGIPVGPGAGLPEAVSSPDVTTTAFQIVTAAALTLLLASRRVSRPKTTRRNLIFQGSSLLVAAGLVAAMTAFAVAPSRACEHQHASEAGETRAALSPLELLQQHDDHDPYRLIGPGAGDREAPGAHEASAVSGETCGIEH